jgi:hypothetical protein
VCCTAILACGAAVNVAASAIASTGSATSGPTSVTGVTGTSISTIKVKVTKHLVTVQARSTLPDPGIAILFDPRPCAPFQTELARNVTDDIGRMTTAATFKNHFPIGPGTTGAGPQPRHVCIYVFSVTATAETVVVQKFVKLPA